MLDAPERTEHEISEAYRRTFLDWSGRIVLEHQRSMFFEGGNDELLAEVLFGDVPHPHRGYMLIAAQRVITHMESYTRVAQAEAEALAGELDIIETGED